MAQIKNYPGYEIDTEGNVYSSKYGDKRLLKPQKVTQSKKKYLAVGLYNKENRRNKDGKLVPKFHYIHRLVWETFLGEIPQGLTVEHIDTNPHNNNLDNLTLLTLGQNVANYWRGEQDGKIMRDNRDEIIKDYIELGTYPRVAKKWGVCENTIRKVIKNRRGKNDVMVENGLSDIFIEYDFRDSKVREKLGMKTGSQFSKKYEKNRM